MEVSRKVLYSSTSETASFGTPGSCGGHPVSPKDASCINLSIAKEQLKGKLTVVPIKNSDDHETLKIIIQVLKGNTTELNLYPSKDYLSFAKTLIGMLHLVWLRSPVGQTACDLSLLARHASCTSARKFRAGLRSHTRCCMAIVSVLNLHSLSGLWSIT